MKFKATFAQQAAAADRKKDWDNATALYNRAALEADMNGESAKSRRHYASANRCEAMQDAARYNEV